MLNAKDWQHAQALFTETAYRSWCSLDGSGEGWVQEAMPTGQALLAEIVALRTSWGQQLRQAEIRMRRAEDALEQDRKGAEAAVAVVRAWEALGRCEDEFPPTEFPGCCAEATDALDVAIIALRKALGLPGHWKAPGHRADDACPEVG